MKSGNSYKSEITFTQGSEEPKVQFSHKLKSTIQSGKEFEIFHETLIKHPELHLDMYSKIDTKAAPGESRHADFIFNINSFKSNAKYESDGQNFLDYTVKAKVSCTIKSFKN
jgi:hypothetical protein